MKIIHNGQVYKSIVDCFTDIDKQDARQSICNDMYNISISVLCFCMASNEYHHNNRIRRY